MASIPWCRRGTSIESNVDSCPPCRVVLEVNTVAGLPINFPEIQISVVASKKAFSGDAIVPKRVGDPKASASHSIKSLFVA